MSILKIVDKRIKVDAGMRPRVTFRPRAGKEATMATTFEHGVIDTPSGLTITVSWDTETMEGGFNGFVTLVVTDSVAHATGYSENDGEGIFASGRCFTWSAAMWCEKAIREMFGEFASQGNDLRVIFAEEACEKLNKILKKY